MSSSGFLLAVLRCRKISTAWWIIQVAGSKLANFAWRRFLVAERRELNRTKDTSHGE